MRLIFVYLLVIAMQGSWSMAHAQFTLLQDINPGSNGSVHESNASRFVHDGRMYFDADDGVHGNELWVTDGTSAGTTLLKDIFPGEKSSHPSFFHALDSTIVFITQDLTDSITYLWRTDGTSDGTELVTSLGPLPVFNDLYSDVHKPSYGEVMNGVLFFHVNGFVWRTDGTVDGTYEIDPSMYGRLPKDFISFNGKLFYTSSSNNYVGNDGWIYYSEGTEESEVWVRGSLYTEAIGLTPIDDRIYFVGHHFGIASDGSEPWITDGTDDGTFDLANINPKVCEIDCSSMSNWPNPLFVKTGRWVVFAADDSKSTNLYRTDGSETGTSLVKKFKPRYSPAFENSLHSFRDAALFFAEDSLYGLELWRTNGEPGNTSLLKDVYEGATDGIPYAYYIPMYTHRDKVYFRGQDATTGNSLWATDGTTAGTVRVAGFYESGLSNSGNFISLGNTLILSAHRDGRGFEYYTYHPPVAPVSISEIIIHPTCADSANGEILVMPTGGVDPFEITWVDPPLDGFHVTGLPAERYIAIVTDAEGNSAFKEFRLIAPPAMEISKKITPATQVPGNGTITITASGGTPPYTYTWSHDAVLDGPAATHLAEGEYPTTITDANGCQEIIVSTVKRITSLDAGQVPVSISFTPNPVTGDEIVLRSRNEFSPGTSFTLYNAQGEAILSGPLSQGYQSIIQVDRLTPGIYIIRVCDAMQALFSQAVIRQ